MSHTLLYRGDGDDHNEKLHKSPNQDLKVFSYDELKRATMGFGYKTCLGEWPFGKVYKGWVDKMTYSPSQPSTGLGVVVKTFEHNHSGILEKSKLDLVLKKLTHPNLLKLIGYCFEGESLFLVDEYMHYGNFEDCLRYGAIARLPLDTKVKIALGIARAVVFLHQQTQHQTASNRSCADEEFLFERCNILLDEDFSVKLSDYNVSMFRPWLLRDDCDIHHPTHNPPPSIYLWSNLTSFTMVLAEILTGEPVSETNPLVKMNDSRHNKEILKDPKSLGAVAGMFFENCNHMDSEYKMLRLLKKFKKHIPS